MSVTITASGGGGIGLVTITASGGGGCSRVCQSQLLLVQRGGGIRLVTITASGGVAEFVSHNNCS